jgi:TPR repeat protein
MQQPGTSWSEGNQGASAVDHAKAKTLYDKACKLKNGLGCFNLANVFRLGEGIKPDLKQAFTYFGKACGFGAVKGCTELGVMYYEGKAVKKDVQRAIDLFEIACKGGSEAACKNHELLTKKSGDK